MTTQTIPDRDAALAALLPRVPGQGWTMAALRDGLRDIGADPLDAELLFPGGVADLLEAFCDRADRAMAAEAATLGLAAMRTPARIRALIALRLRQAAPDREAVRRALALLALPRNARLALRCTARSVDAIWHAAGDRSADFSWYTKRAILGAVLSATMLFWLRDASGDDSATLDFLDRRLAQVGRLGQLRRRAEGALARLRPAAAG